MTFGFDSPLPPADSGVADYAGRLLAALRGSEALVLRPQRADRWLYHIGNNREHHGDIYARAVRERGVVVLHDAVLIHLLLSLSENEERFASEFAYNYGAWHEDLGKRLWRDRARSGADAAFFQYPMLKRIANAAQAVIVHNPKAAALVRDHAPEVRVVEIPHFALEAEVDAVRVESWRQRCGFPRSTYVFGVFGHLRESKRILPLLRVFERLRRLGADAGLIFGGRFQSEALERAAQPLLSTLGVRQFGYLREEDLRALIGLADCGVNLRWPAAGESSGIGLRLMAAGKPVILTRGAETEPFPEGTCIKVDAGLHEEDLLLASMRWLVDTPAAGRRMGALAREHLMRYHSLDRIANLYWEVLRG